MCKEGCISTPPRRLQEDVNKETLKKQFEIVHKETTTSDVLQWGELSLDKHTVGTFVGSGSADLDDYGPFPTESDPCLVSANCS